MANKKREQVCITPTAKITQADADAVMEYDNDPVGFAHDVLAIPYLEPFQIELLESIRDNKQTAVASGKGPGKTFALSISAIWWMLCRPGGCVQIVNASVEQAQHVDLRQIRELMDGLHPCQTRPSVIKHWFDHTKTQITPVNQTTSFIFISAANENKPETLQGRHMKPMLVIGDEAARFGPEIHQGLMGNVTDTEDRILLIGNPKYLGFPFNLCFTDWADRWHTINVDTQKCKFVSRESIEEIRSAYGEDSDFFRVFVQGLFPKQSASGFLSMQDLNACLNQVPPESYTKLPVVAGLDVSRNDGGGDATTLYFRQGRKFLKSYTFHINDGEALKLHVCNLYKTHNCTHIVVDETGIGGFLVDGLRALLGKYNITGVQFAGRAHRPERYSNRRQEIWGDMKERILSGLDFTAIEPAHRDTLFKELTNVECFIDKNNHLAIEPKSAMKSRGLDSPDHSDAVALSLAVEPGHVTTNPPPAQFMMPSQVRPMPRWGNVRR